MRKFLLSVAALACGALALSAQAASARSVLYVGNSTGDDVAVIDLATQKMITKIKVGQTVHGICPTSDGRRAYVTVESNNTIQVVDTSSHTVIDTIPLPGRPNECAVTKSGRYIVVPLLAPANSAVIIEAATKQIVKTLPLIHPHNCFAPEGGSDVAIWCEERDRWRINRIDMTKLEYSDYVNVAGDPRPFIVSADEKTIFTALSGLHGFATIDRPSKMESMVTLGSMPLMSCRIEPANTPTHGIERTPDRKKLWITSVSNGAVYIYDIASRKLSAPVKVGACPNWINFSEDGKYAAVSNADDDNISILDARTARELARIPTGNAPKRLHVIEVPEEKSASASSR
jgi:YVTN family beta-propeller protein